jgi:hypothetical protein
MAPIKKTSRANNSRRTAFRFNLANKKLTYMANGRMGRAILQNISTSGCFAKNNDTELVVNEQILIVIELEVCDKPLELKAKVVRIGAGGFSAEFTHIEESFQTEFSTMLATEQRNSLSNLIPIEK